MSGGIFLLVRRSLRQHAFSTIITVLAVGLASGLTMSVFSIQQQTREAFSGGDVGFDAVLGARGSQLQLVLNTVFHLETSPGNIPWSVYEKLKHDTPGIRLAIPYATGDNYFGYRIVGTSTELFTDFEYQKGQKFQFVGDGRSFEDGYAEAVVGSYVAEQLGISVGDHIHPSHGVNYAEGSEHEDEYTVVGILEPTNSPSDRVVWIPIEGIFHMDGHVLKGAGEHYEHHGTHAIPEEHKEVSAVMLSFSSPTLGMNLNQQINMIGKEYTLAFPIGRVMLELFDKIGWVNRIFELVAYLVVLVSGAAILASIYNTINERRREFAILRALGARRRTVFSAIVLEAATIAALGSVLGWVFYGVILFGASYAVRKETGVVLEVFMLHPSLYLTPIGMTLLGALTGIVPAYKAYATDVAENLIPHS